MYWLSCPSFHWMDSSCACLLAVIPVGRKLAISYFFQISIKPQGDNALNLCTITIYRKSYFRNRLATPELAHPPKPKDSARLSRNLPPPNLLQYHHTAPPNTTRCSHLLIAGHPEPEKPPIRGLKATRLIASWLHSAGVIRRRRFRIFEQMLPVL